MGPSDLGRRGTPIITGVTLNRLERLFNKNTGLCLRRKPKYTG